MNGASVEPWLSEALQRLADADRQGRLAHAILLMGPPGLAKRSLAMHVAAGALCERDDGIDQPCGECKACTLRLAGNHPDLHLVEPPPDKQSIGVDQVRELSGKLALQSHHGGRTVAIVAPAEAMTLSASNALLKTLEEPGQGRVLLLVTDHAARLPITILSRCQQVRLTPPTTDDALAWLAGSRPDASADAIAAALAASGGAPYLALVALSGEADAGDVAREVARELTQLAQRKAEPVGVARRLQGPAPEAVIGWMTRSLVDVLGTRLAARDAAHNPWAGDALGKAIAHVPAAAIGGFLERLAEARTQLLGQVNPQLLFESLMVEWAKTTAPTRSRHR